MKDMSEILKIFNTLNPKNQALLLRCARTAQVAEEAAKKSCREIKKLRPKKEE
jgi:hypothetical protein